MDANGVISGIFAELTLEQPARAAVLASPAPSGWPSAIGVTNYQGVARGPDRPLPTRQLGAMGILC